MGDHIFSFIRPGHLTRPTVSELYTILYDTIASNPAAVHGREGIYIGKNGQCNLYDVAKAMGETMIELKATEPSSFTKEVSEIFWSKPTFSMYIRPALNMFPELLLLQSKLSL